MNLFVVFGGKATEHDVSIISALQAIENIDKNKYDIYPIYISKNGDFYFNKELLLDLKNYKNINSLLRECKKITFYKSEGKTYLTDIEKGLFKKPLKIEVDIIFPIVHGTNVEDGNLYGYFHTLEVPIVGSDVLSSALGMDKYVFKMYLKSCNIPTIHALKFNNEDLKDILNIVSKVEKEFEYPVIIKPINLGSSIGISKANNKEKLIDALNLAFSFANNILVEKAIVNLREINCSVIGNKTNCETSLLEEPFGKDEILSFQDKYLSSGNKKGISLKGTKGKGSIKTGSKTQGMASLQRRIPADIDKNMEEKISNYAKETFLALGCSGVVRIDFIIDKDTNDIFVNEINTIPGSLSFYLWESKGIKYKDLIDKLIDIAIENYKIENKVSYTFENNLFK